jgi:hypothetical protein
VRHIALAAIVLPILVVAALTTRTLGQSHTLSPGAATPARMTTDNGAAALLAGGPRTIFISHGTDPPRFSIVGERYRLFGEVHFAMQIEIEGSGGGEPARGTDQRLLAWSFWTGCRPHEYAVLYGLLKVPRDSAWARTSGGVWPLRRVATPSSLDAGGVLVYAVLPTLPSELHVRSPDGAEVLSEGLGSLPREDLETCAARA